GLYGGGAGYNPMAATNASNAAASAPAIAAAAAAGGDLTGTYLGNAPGGAGAVRGPRVIANPLNNTLLIQATPQEYENLQQLIEELDVPPRQVLIEAKIYSIDLSRAFDSDISGSLKAAPAGTTTVASLLGSLGADGSTTFSAATLVGRSRELLGTVTLLETEKRAKILSSPSVIASDSIPASIQVGTTVPTLSGSIASGVTGGVTQAVSNASTGIGLNIVARVTPSGIVTMIINQSVTDPTPTTTSNISSPSFDTKSVSTQVTVQDGDTIAIGGMIQESTNTTVNGIPILDRLPYVGALFGAKSYGKDRSELVIFITPHVIYDTNQMTDATDELRTNIKLLRKDVKE
ncbi:MAG TPA: secretin N-terminal domain-containing protein, partial [Bryobacteraceae bacterium]